MASLTPLSKGLIGLAVIGAVASAVWNLGLKERVLSRGSFTPSPQQAPTPVVIPPPTTAPVATQTSAAPAAPPTVTSATGPGGKVLTATESGEKGRQLLDSGDYAQARIFLEQAVKMGDGPAACHLGEMTLKGQGGIVSNQTKAAELFRLAQSRNMICFASGN